jgi:potassium-transporting ATPase KdpC subunit
MNRILGPAIKLTIVLTVLLGTIYPLGMTGLARLLFPHQAAGSLVTQNGTIVGSRLIGQRFTWPGYFHPRPSAAGDGYDATSSGGTNLGPLSAKLLHGEINKEDPAKSFAGVEQIAAAVRQENSLPATTPLPVDAVTRSASGLDPDISLANAHLQVARIARQRGLTAEQVEQALKVATRPRQLGILGEPRMNVLEANLRLDELAPGQAGQPQPDPRR